jgi:hypothetical protein
VILVSQFPAADALLCGPSLAYGQVGVARHLLGALEATETAAALMWRCAMEAKSENEEQEGKKESSKCGHRHGSNDTGDSWT